MTQRATFPQNIFGQIDRMQRDMQQAFGFAPVMRGSNWGGFPAMNMGITPEAVTLYVFVPGVPSENIEVHVDKGVLIIAGSRDTRQPDGSPPATRHLDERYSGRFRRVITLPDDVNEDQVCASYRDGVLHITVSRRETPLSRKIPVQ